MYCAKCGAQVRDGEIYCKKCKRETERGNPESMIETPPREEYENPAYGQFDETPENVPPVPDKAGIPVPDKIDIPADPAEAQAPKPAAPAAGQNDKTMLRNLEDQLPALRRGMAINAVICIGGLLVSLFSYSAVSQIGGTYYLVFWGAVLYGAVRFLRFLSYYSKAKAKIESIRQRPRDE